MAWRSPGETPFVVVPSATIVPASKCDKRSEVVVGRRKLLYLRSTFGLETFLSRALAFKKIVWSNHERSAPPFRKAENQPEIKIEGRLEIPQLSCTVNHGNRNLCTPRRSLRSKDTSISSNITSQARPRPTAHSTKYNHLHSRWSTMYGQEEECCLG